MEFPFDPESKFKKWAKIGSLPKNDFIKQAVLVTLMDHFDTGAEYKESQVNEIIRNFFDDYVLVRRELINFNYLRRNPRTGIYWVHKKTLSEQDIENNTILRRHAKAYRQ